MKHVFKQLAVYQPKTKVGESYKPSRFEIGTAIIDLEYISAVYECVIFENENKQDDEVLNWLKEKQLILARIILKDGTKFSNIIVPNMNYFGIILGDVTF